MSRSGLVSGVQIDWLKCAAVEVVSGKVAGAPVIRETRVRPQDLMVNRDEGIPWLVKNFGVPADTVRDVFAFHDRHKALKTPEPV